MERSWGVLGEGAVQDLVIPVGTGTMVPVPTGITRSRTAPSPRTPQESSTHSCITDPKVQSQPEDGPHIGPKHVVVIILL